MQYREDLGYKYPERSDQHMIGVKHLRDTNFDIKEGDPTYNEDPNIDNYKKTM